MNALCWEGVSGQWKEFAECVEIDEDWIDQIYTNNENDLMCFDNVVDIWVQRMAPTWKKLSLILRALGRNDLADKAWNDGKMITTS